MKKMVSLLIVLAMLLALAPAAFATTIPEGGTELALGNNDLNAGNSDEYYPEVKEYYFVAQETGTLYLTLRSFGYGDYNAGEELLGEDYSGWVQLRINGERFTSMEQSLEVTAGDLVNITLESVDGDLYFAKLYLSYESFYEESVGTDLNPVEVYVADLPTYTVEIPAGEEFSFRFEFDFFDYSLTIYGEDVYLVVSSYNEDTDEHEPYYIYAVDGVLTYTFDYGLSFKIGNAGEEAQSFYMECKRPVGIYNNPDTLVVGEQTANVPGDYNGYWYAWTAPENGTLTVTVTGDNWGFDLSNENTGEYISLYQCDGDSNVADLEVSEGDQVLLNVLTIADGWMGYPGGELTVTVEFTTSSAEDGEAEILYLYLQNNYLKVREGWGAPVTKEYAYIAETTGTLYITFRSFGCFGNHWPESYLTDEYYLEGFSLLLNGEPVTQFKNALEVTEGDTVVLTIASLDGYPYETNVWLSYEDFYEDAVGSELNPVQVFVDDLPAYTVEIPAGEELYFKFAYDFYDYTLTIHGEDAYIVVNRYNEATDETEPYYIYAVDGVVTYDFSDGTNIRIGNAGDTAASFYMEGKIPVGIANNPDTLTVGEVIANVPSDYNGYWYSWVAPENGTLTITVTGDNWGFDLSNETANEYIYRYAFTGDSNVAILEVSAGDEILLNLLTIGAGGWGDYPGGELTVTVEFTPAAGEEEPEVMFGDANGDGVVNYLDAMLIAQYYVGDIADAELNLDAADVNGDGSVNYLDAMMVAQYYVGDIDQFPGQS